MSRVLKVETKVLPGGRIELCEPSLPAGKIATVLISIDEAVPKQRFRQVLGGYKGGQLFTTGDEVDAYLRTERDAWDS